MGWGGGIFGDFGHFGGFMGRIRTGKGLFGVILCVAFPNFCLGGWISYVGVGGLFLGILNIFGGFGK
jgi:hypothetical protein